MEGIVVAGELGAFLEAATGMGDQVSAFMASYQQLVRRYMHSRPLFSKFIGDEFIYVYESASPAFARNILHSTMVLESAFQEAVQTQTIGLEGLRTDALRLSSLNIGMAEGRLFRIDARRGVERDVVGFPLQVARTLAGRAADVQSHILVDHDMSLDLVCRQWLELETKPIRANGGKPEAARIVTSESLVREYRNDRERYQVVNAVEVLKEDIDKIARPEAFSFRLTRDGRPHVEVMFNPQSHRGTFDPSIASSILLVHVTPGSLTLYPEFIVPSDRVYTIQLPVPVVEEYQIVIGLVIQSPEITVISDEITKIQEPGAIVARLEAMRALLQSSRRLENRLALAYYRF
ncbi:hypothetical protein ACFLR0_01860 [Candidatus Bipolaricaulota bacterium]